MIIESCNLCSRRCGVRRDENGGNGFCKAGTTMKVARIAPHFGEEPCISGKRGSGAVFFSHCVLNCIFCQNYKISHGGFGKDISPLELANKFKELEKIGVHNINLVSGTQYIPLIRQALLLHKPQIPVIFNCSGYESAEGLRLLNGLVDVYLPDFKYNDNSLAYRYSKALNYKASAVAAIEEMLNQVGSPSFDDDGMIKSGVIIRHLVLPSATKNSIGVLKQISESFGSKVLVSLMAQYTPCAKAVGHELLGRKITKREYQKVLDVLIELGLDGYAQELSSSGREEIPDFDLTGL